MWHGNDGLGFVRYRENGWECMIQEGGERELCRIKSRMQGGRCSGRCLEKTLSWVVSDVA